MEIIGRVQLRPGELLTVYAGRDDDQLFDHALLHFAGEGNCCERHKLTVETLPQVMALLSTAYDRID